MRHALFLVLALGLAACAPAGKAPDQTSPAGLTDSAIEVTTLDAATGAGGTAPTVQAGQPLTATGDAGKAAPSTEVGPAAEAATLDTVPVSAATPSTPHPRPRPAGLGETESASDTAAEEAPAPKSQLQLQCEAANGIWGQAAGGGFLCQKRMKDGGKVCHKKDDCMGECLGPSQTCSPVAPLMGCNDVMDAEGRQVTLCLD